MRILITGASGFIGQRLLQALSGSAATEVDQLIALRRTPSSSNPAETSSPMEWRTCDLFSLAQTEAATQGADVGIYLVHSMMPAARLTQSRFEDTDLLLADNFARACKRNGVKTILYLGGLIPETRPLSAHLQSRLEVEAALASYGAKVITLRAGLIIGQEGSSFQLLSTLVRRLPVLICPKWTRSKTQPIAASDLVQTLLEVIRKHTQVPAGSYDIGSPSVITYQKLMETTAEELGLKRRFFSVPFFTPGLSLLWVQLITGASRNLILPLIQSLKHEMLVKNAELWQWLRPTDTTPPALLDLSLALKEAIRTPQPTSSRASFALSLRESTRQRKAALKKKSEVRSIQRLTRPEGWRAEAVATAYFRWLPRKLSPLIHVSRDKTGVWSFHFFPLPWVLLKLAETPERSTPDRALFLIRGGLLVSRQSPPLARLEFREVLGGKVVLAAIQEFVPSLPWVIYKFTQAIIHLWVMSAFEHHLRTGED